MGNYLDNGIGALGNIVTGGEQKNAIDSQESGVDNFRNIELPDIETMKIHLQDLVSQGKITPEQASTYLQQNTQMSGISTNPEDTRAQLDALHGLQQISNEGGLTAIDQAKLGQIKTQEDTQARGAREAILQNAQARGVGGSGLELQSELMNAQHAATDQSQRDLDVGAMAQKRALDALIQGGQLGGQMQQNEFNQKAQIASSQDAINRFNAANQQSQENFNVAGRNNAQQSNLSNDQDIANQNVGLHNTQEVANKNLPQVGFQNQIQKATGTTNAYNNLSNTQSKAAKNNKEVLGSGIEAVAAAFSDVRLKEDVEKFDPSDFLDSLTSYKYNYKKPELGEGKHAGVMAQDLEKTPEGAAMVEDTPEGKRVDYGKGFNTLLASLVDMHRRVKELEGAH